MKNNADSSLANDEGKSPIDYANENKMD